MHLQERRRKFTNRHTRRNKITHIVGVETAVFHQFDAIFHAGRGDHIMEFTHGGVHNIIERMGAATGGRFDPEGSAALIFDDVDVGMNVLLKGRGGYALPRPDADLEFQLFLDVGDTLEDGLLRGLNRQADQLDAQVFELVEDIKVGANHLQLRLDFQIGAETGRLDNIKAAAGHVEVHVLAVAHLNMDPIDAGRFQFLHRLAQPAVIGPEKTRRHFTLLLNFTNGVAHYFTRFHLFVA